MPVSDSLSLLDGSTFVVSNHRGVIEARADFAAQFFLLRPTGTI